MDNNKKTSDEVIIDEIIRRFDELYYTLGLLKGLIDKYKDIIKK